MNKRGLWSLFLFALGCGQWESSGPDRLRDAYPASCGQEDLGSQVPDGAIVVTPSDRVVGTWAGQIVQKGRMKIPTVCDDCLLTLTDFVLIVIPSDGQFALWRFCDQAMEMDTTPEDPNDPADPLAPHSIVPPALQNAGVSTVVTFDRKASETVPAHRVVWLWGVRDMPDPFKDPLPDSADSLFVFDQDQDGKPGVTIRVVRPIEGERYMVRRAVWDVGEAQLSENHLWATATLAFTIEEKALGADNAMLTILAPITPETTGNSVLLRRVPSDFTCADLRSHAASLFAEAPKP